MNESLTFLRIVSYNINAYRENLKSFFELHSDADIILVQEIRPRIVRHVPSSSDPFGDPYSDIPRHPDWIGLTPTPHTDNRVATYVNRRLASLAPTVDPRIKHPDMLLVTLRCSHRPFSVLNVYSDPTTHAAV